MADQERLWPFPGEPLPVVVSLFSRIEEHSPELVLQIRHYLDQNGESLTHRRSYDGTDAAARLSILLVEALMAFEQVRMELLEQTTPTEGKLIPAHMALAMSEALQLEPALLHIAKSAFALHLYTWDAHSSHRAPVSEEVSEDKESVEDRGRWGASTDSGGNGK